MRSRGPWAEEGGTVADLNLDSKDGSGVAQTMSVGKSTSVTSGAAKVFREFKWGLFTLFLLMVVVIALVYDGGRKKKPSEADAAQKSDSPSAIAALDSGPEAGAPPATTGGLGNAPTPPAASNPVPAHSQVAETVPAPAPMPTQNGSSAAPSTPESKPVAHAEKKAGESAPKSDAAAGAERTYQVKAGDTLTSIANTMLPGKNSVKVILEANKSVLSDANKIRVGMTLKIPASLPAVAEAAKSESVKKADSGAVTSGGKETSKAGGTEYIVQAGDTLEKIARKLFNDRTKWREIYDWNRDQLAEPGRLRAGQVLKVKSATTTASTAPASGSHAEGSEATELSSDKPAIAKAGVLDKQEPAMEVMSRTSSANLP